MPIKSFASKFLKPQQISRIKVIVLMYPILTRLFRLRYFSLNNLDAELESFMNFNDGYFVELGANDGVNQSNTLYFEKFRGWRGVLIEPYLPNFEQLTRNRSSSSFCKYAACVGPSYDAKKVRLIYSNLMTSPLDIASEIPSPVEHAKNGEHYWGGNAFVFEAPAMTLNSILIEAKSPETIDLLSLDVEGVELEVLKGIDHTKFRFRYICVESRNVEPIGEYLRAFQYQYVKQLSTNDHLFRAVDS